jgi:transcription initiation protein SPT3
MSLNNPTLDALLSSPIGPKWTISTSRGSYTQEIQQMMYGFGDYDKPLYESAQLIEEIVHQQMTSLLCEASRVAQTRGSRFIGIEEILFLMRFDRLKLCRLVKYLSVKDIKSITKSASLDEQETIESALTSDTIPTNSSDEITPKPPQQTKRVKLCYDFLSSIDKTGALLVVFDENFIDSVKHERNVRSDEMARSMNQSQYMKYFECRQTSFANKARPSKFRDWLLRDSQIEIKPNLLALEVLQYLAYESVSQIVDLSLLVKQDSERDICDPLTSLLPYKMTNDDFPIYHSNTTQSTDSTDDYSPNNMSQNNSFVLSSQTTKSIPKSPLISSIESSKSKKRKKTDMKLSFESSHSYCITPNHIREAMRRYFTPSGPFVKLHKSSLQSSIHNKKLLCI